MVSVNAACCTGLPHAADVVMGTLSSPPCCPEDLPADVTTRPVTDDDMDGGARDLRRGAGHPQRHLRDRRVPTAEQLRRRWLPGAGVGRRARRRGRRLDRGHARCRRASATPASARRSVYVAEAARGRGVGKALLFTQVNEADKAGLWTLQTSIFPENRASLALHHSAGYRTLAVRTRIAQLDGVWRDTVLLERRSEVN